MNHEALMVWCPFPDLASARNAVAQILPMGLAACVHCFPQGESHFLWNGGLETSSETMTVWKTTSDCWEGLSKSLAEVHPYDTPAILATPVSALPEACLAWLQASITRPPSADASSLN